MTDETMITAAEARAPARQARLLPLRGRTGRGGLLRGGRCVVSGLVTVPGDALPGLLGRGSVVLDGNGNPSVVISPTFENGDWLTCRPFEGMMEWMAGSLRLILHDPNDEYVSRAGYTAAWAAVNVWAAGADAEEVGRDALEEVYASLLEARDWPSASLPRAEALRDALLAASTANTEQA